LVWAAYIVVGGDEPNACNKGEARIVYSRGRECIWSFR
jgi:hypothetical protein